MKKQTKFILYPLLALVLLALLLFGLNKFAEYKIKKSLDEAFTAGENSYGEVDVNLLQRKLSLREIAFQIKGRNVEAKSIKASGVHIFDYLLNDKIIVNRLEIQQPYFLLNQQEKDTTKNASGKGEMEEDVLIKTFSLSNGDLRIIENDTSENLLFISGIQLDLDEIRINSKTLENPLPFTFEHYTYKSDSLFFEPDERHMGTVGTVEIRNDNTTINDFQLIPRYEKEEFQKYIPHELDRFDLIVEEVQLKSLEWNLEEDNLVLESPFTRISGVDLQVYRDKLQPEDTGRKPMYSKMLRELPVKLDLDTIELTEMYIKYEENLDEERPPGTVDFHNMHATIYDLANKGMQQEDFPDTEIDVRTQFMGEAPLKVNWVFNVSDTLDRFNISGNMARLSAEGINKFFEPGLNLRADGDLDDMQFNFSGNHTTAKGDMRLKYENFKVEVLRKGGDEKNTIVSALANLIINNDAQNEEVYQEDITVERDKTKSFWNYLWKCIRNGALKSFF